MPWSPMVYQGMDVDSGTGRGHRLRHWIVKQDVAERERLTTESNQALRPGPIASAQLVQWGMPPRQSLPNPDVRAAFREMWNAIAPIGRSEPGGGYRRFAWTPVDLELREWFASECARRGLDLSVDAVGNQWAWWGDPDAATASGAPGVVAGSHLDSVPDGGAFDGPLGVVSALAAVDELRARGVMPARPVGVVNFVDEEGARFGVACAGSRVLTGAMTPDRARSLTDADGITMAEAMGSVAHDPDAIGPDPETLGRVGSYVELHIEQGRLLADLDAPLAVGNEIWPHGRWRIDVPGEANHAGTTRLEDRDDAMLGLATAVIVARRAAERHDCLATVGKVEVTPGGVNAIPSATTGWLDARASKEETVRALVEDLAEALDDFGATLTEESWTPATAFDPGLVRRVATRLGGIPVIGTGAGHDAGILAGAGLRAVMLFVRNPTGVSHSPREWATEEDCLLGISALATVLADLAGDSANAGDAGGAGGAGDAGGAG